MISLLIVEDEPLIADDIATTLEKSGYEVTAIVDNAEDAFTKISAKSPDLAILDINIEGDMDGIELASQLKIPFIFVTSYYDKETLDKVSMLSPSGFIVKPFNSQDLVANVELARRRKIVGVKQEEVVSETIFIRDQQSILSLKPKEILFAEAMDNYTVIHTKSKKHTISHTLKSVEEKLLKYGFLRIHRSYLINFDKIDSISENLVYIKGHHLSVGKSFRKNLIASLEIL
ncbi:LytR/AlgR family response regulator transcription factor [Ekhidna sp.]